MGLGAFPQLRPEEEPLVRRSGCEVPLKLICSSYMNNGRPQLAQFGLLPVSKVA